MTNFKKINLQKKLIIYFGILLRFLNINSHKIWFDEHFSINLASLEIPHLLQAAAYDNQPPFYYLFLKIFQEISLDPLFLRLISVIIGSITLLVLNKLSSLFLNKKAQLIILLLVSLSPLHIYYSTEIRMYEFMTLEMLLVIWTVAKYIKTNKVKYLCLYLLFTNIAIYTSYFQVIFILCLGVITFIYCKNNFLKWSLFTSIPFILLVPWLLFTLPLPKPPCWCQSPFMGTWGAFASFTLGLMGHFDIYDAFFGTKIPFLLKLLYLANPIFFFSLYIFSWKKHSFKLFYPIQFLLWLPFLFLSIINIKIHMFSVRSFILFSPFYYAAIADYLSQNNTYKIKYLLFLSCFLLLTSLGLNLIYAFEM